uniref:Zonadhesin-like n=1 Tax=Callorhinchus milii TaxID=7868 RepID=A0A4W3IN49_CALMI
MVLSQTYWQNIQCVCFISILFLSFVIEDVTRSEKLNSVNFPVTSSGSSTCTASGDPHYTSFDKKKFNFHGNCTYVMSQTCNSTQTPFSVYASNEHRNGKKTVSYVKAVYVQVYGITVSILKKKVVQVNGKTVTVPINPVREVTIKPSGKHVVVQTDFGLIVRYDGVMLSLCSYADELCGLCGDYNGSPSDDFRTPEGKLVKGVNDFGNSWNVDDK